jgi:hypothetical protein
MSESPATPPVAETVAEAESEKPKHWSDRKADTVGVLVIFTAVVLAAVQFISGGLSS